MKHYLMELPEYAARCAQRLDLFVGIVAGVVFFLIAVACGLGRAVIIPVTTAIVILAILEAGYGVYREERTMRAEREKHVRVQARLGALSTNTPDPGPDKVSVSAHVFWEIWVDQDVSTDALALNLIYVYDNPWWQFWKRSRVPKMGIPPKGEDTTQYRIRIRADNSQPFRDSAVFEYVSDRREEGDPHWLLELVLVTGVPPGRHCIPVFIDYDELRSRGTNPPL